MLLNQRKIVNVNIVTSEKAAKRIIAKPTFESFTIINEGITLCKSRKDKIKWTQPTHVGGVILEYAI